MGTSRSSPGAPPGVPLIPPWVEDPGFLPPPDPTEDGDDASPPGDVPEVPEAIAPAARFRPARSALTRFAREGSRADLQHGLGAYVGRGLGGAALATRRLGRVPITASSLNSALATPSEGLRELALSGATIDQLEDALIDAVRPVDGTLDGEASRQAIKEALSHLLHVEPGVDLLALNEEQRLLVIERFAAFEVWSRFELDVGRAVHEHAPSLRVAAERMQEARRFVLEAIAQVFRSIPRPTRVTARIVRGHVEAALRRTFEVFQGYLE